MEVRLARGGGEASGGRVWTWWGGVGLTLSVQAWSQSTEETPTPGSHFPEALS